LLTEFMCAAPSVTLRYVTDEEELQMLTELMCAAPSGFRNIKSALTLALMEDSGWYQVGFRV
jgi:hypothetical protein